MQRTFTVELTEREAATVCRMAAASGVPAAQIVRYLHRTKIFNVLASLANDDTWTFTDDRTGQVVASEDMCVSACNFDPVRRGIGVQF